VTANQDDEMSDKETFQIEFDTKKDQWRVRTADNVYWKVADASGIQATDDGRSVNLYSRRTYHGQIQDLLVGYAHGSFLIRVRDPDRHQNLNICSLSHFQPSLKISRKGGARKFLRKVANRQTNRQTTMKT